MKRIVFYSWQSDLPNPTNRGFIQDALENAATAITSDSSVAIEPVVDRDTQGVAGAPDIASTIFAKITAADVFVADISIISHPKDGRPTPNPNVLIELGYALRGLGHERVILVFNEAFGNIAELPFDLRTRRLMVYNMPAENKDRASEKKKLEAQLDGAIRAALGHAPAVEDQPSIPAISAIENNQPNKIIVLRRNLAEITKKIDDRQPKKHSDGGTADDLTAAIDSTQELVAEFSKIIEVVSIMKDQEVSLEIYKWFGKIFDNYTAESGAGRTSNADGDYFKFVGHEMFVTMIALYLREQRWDILKKILAEPIPVKYVRYENGPSSVYWNHASQHLALLLAESSKKQRISLHSDILNARHTTGGLSATMPMDEFTAADFFLFLFGELSSTEYRDGFFEWRPWSVLFMNRVPRFIKNAEQRQYAQHLADVLNVPSIDELKKRLKERHEVVRKLFTGGLWHTSISNTDIDKIATR